MSFGSRFLTALNEFYEQLETIRNAKGKGFTVSKAKIKAELRLLSKDIGQTLRELGE